ncbi:MAG TPA: hydroxysqualene dehydroxylase HpnE [Terriglobales bacterium]|jgi:squalene-associated FAD-dependent desaturase|nr:hydroxysqualene dehydroxylase HpnE [Terriglobales bacterium]
MPASLHPETIPPATVAIAGGGLAGLAAGCALAEAGFRVSLFERRSYLGGRASSYQHPGTGEIVDNCQHVLLGCCTNLLDFYRRAGTLDKIRWYEKLTFLEPGGRASVISPSALPAPLHTAPAFLRADCLSLSDKLSISRAMAALAPSTPGDNGQTFLDWLKRHGQTAQAIERFWKTILVSALNEDLDQISVFYAAQVVRESFLKSAAAGRMGIPTVPLTELYSTAGDYVRARGGEIQLRAAVESFRAGASGVSVTANGQEHKFDYLVLAVPFNVLGRMLPDGPSAAPLAATLEKFSTSPITGIHLWFDRQISDLDHAVLLDRTIQWMFHKSRLIAARSNEDQNSVKGGGSYVELVVSCSRSLVEKSKVAIVEMATKEMQEFFPSAREAKLLKSTVIKEVHATYSPRPGIDEQRPKSETAWPRVFLAGDWIATGWPATMEGAVRSGYLSAEALARFAGTKNPNFLVPDLPARGLMRLFK